MSIASQLEEAQAYLNSTRLTDRKRSLDLLTDILMDETVAQCLNQGQPFTWDMLLRDVQTCLKKVCLTKNSIFFKTSIVTLKICIGV